MKPERKDYLASKLTELEKVGLSLGAAACRLNHEKLYQFSGLFGEYLKTCHEAQAIGVDWDSIDRVPIAGYHKTYIKEKISKIFDRQI